MVIVYFPPSVPHIYPDLIGVLHWRISSDEVNEYYGIGQQILAQALGWTQ